MSIYPYVIIVAGIIAAAVLGVVVDWLLKLALPRKPRRNHIVFGLIAVVILAIIAAWPSIFGISFFKDLFADVLETKSVFPFFVGSSWTYNVGMSIEGETRSGFYTETIYSMESGLSDEAQIITSIKSGENFINDCEGPYWYTGEYTSWYVIDDYRVYHSCSLNEAYEIANLIIHGNPSELIPYPIEFVVPFEVGSRWYAGFEIPNSNDPAYQWYVENLVDVAVPAGNYTECYRIMLFTIGNTTTRWVCPGVGVVAREYNKAQIVSYRAELAEYTKP